MKWLVIWAGVVLLVSCSRSPYRGFKQVNDRLHLKLHVLGDGDLLPTDSDSVLMRVRVARFGDHPGSLFSTEAWYAMHDSAQGFIATVFGRMHEGDSLSIISRASEVPWARLAPRLSALPSGHDTVTMELSLRVLLTPRVSRKAIADRIAADPVGHERNMLKPFQDTSQWRSWDGQLFYRITSNGGENAAVKSGDLVTIHYTGRFVNEKIFDDTRRTAQALTFRLGDPGQVIHGLEVAAHLLNPGGRGTFVLPSAMAFGAKGSSNGIVPPFTPVIYDVEVVGVERQPKTADPG